MMRDSVEARDLSNSPVRTTAVTPPPYNDPDGRTPTDNNGGYFDLPDLEGDTVGTPMSVADSLNLGVGSMVAAAAFAALQYLPLPILVLSQHKRVVVANEAMGRLFGLDPESFQDEESKSITISDVLRGMSMSNLGIDMLQGGCPIWTNWEEFLDSIASEGSKLSDPTNNNNRDVDGGNGRNSAQDPEKIRRKSSAKVLPRLNSANLTSTTVLDAAVDVVISPQRDLQGKASPVSKDKISRNPLTATMIISIWPFEDDSYFTLTFTNADAQKPSIDSRPSTRRVAKQSSVSPKLSGPSSSASSTGRRSYASGGTSAGATPTASSMTSPVLSEPAFPPHGPPLRSNWHSTHSLFQKATQLKDAILNSITMPAYAMWKDESFGMPNKALSNMCVGGEKYTVGHQREFLSQFEVWTDDFKRKLEIDEFPIVELCRSQTGGVRRVGMRNPETHARIVYDVVGQPVLDDRTGEFLGGIVVFKDVTEYTRRIAHQIRENEKQFEYIANLVPIMIWRTQPNGIPDWYSQRWYDYTGLSPEALDGTGWMSAFHADDMPETNRRWAYSCKTGAPYTVEYRCRRYDGQWRWMLGQALPFRDSDGNILKWFGTCTDIHDVVEARQTAKDTREQLQRVIEHTHTTLWTVDTKKNLRLLEGNMQWRTSEERIQLGSELGKPIDEVFPSNEVSPLIDRIIAGTSMEEFSEVYYAPADRWFRSRLIPSYSTMRTSGKEGQGVLDGVIGMTLDVTDVRKSEQELREQEKANSNLVANAVAAKEASKMKSQFLANMSHEIRTPIAGVIGMSELLIDTNLDQEQRECAENINRSANSLLTVINDILDFSKVESGRLDIEEVQFSLSVVIRDVNKMLSYAASRKELAYESDVQGEVERDFKVMGDPGRLRQILTNLLTNSIKFTSEGSVKLKAQIIGETAEVVKVSFEVEDTGIGIEEEVRKRLFTPFSQADSSTARRYGGTGLGLTICKNLVELMHGQIELQSKLGQGTRAVFWIPFNKVSKSEQGSPLVDLSSIPDRLQSEISVSCSSLDGERTPPLHGTPDANGRRASGRSPDDPLVLTTEERAKTHVLVVEDNQINQQIALKTIKKLGYSVNAVWNGQEALDYLMSTPTVEKPRPDIILMDCQMPVMDGLQATQIIRSEEPFASSTDINQIPIVAMTASAIQGDKEKCMEVGMQDYLAKPVRGKVLERMLSKWAIVGRRKQPFPQHRPAHKPRRPSHLSSSLAPSPADSPTQSFRGVPAGSVSDAVQIPAPAIPNHHDKERLLSMDSQSSSLAAELNRISFQSDNALARAKETDNERAMRRLQEEETALKLRDEKLLAASTDPRDALPSPVIAGAEKQLRRASLPGLDEERGIDGSASLPLTVENVKKMEEGEGDTSASRKEKPPQQGLLEVQDGTNQDIDSRSSTRPSLKARQEQRVSDITVTK